MNQQNKREFKDLITSVLAFYRQDVSTFALGVWWAACSPFDIEQVRQALNAHAIDSERGQFAPKPADIVRALQGTRTEQARLAWGKAFDAMQQVGAYQSVTFDDPVIHLVIEDLGGWQKVCRSTMDELSYLEHRFCEAYRAYAGRPLGEYPSRLLGEFECINRREGRKVAPPMLVGNPQRAAEVLRLGGAGGRTQFTLASDVIPALQLKAPAA